MKFIWTIKNTTDWLKNTNIDKKILRIDLLIYSLKCNFLNLDFFFLTTYRLAMQFANRKMFYRRSIPFSIVTI